MKCPKCKKEINWVYVFKEFKSRGHLEGNKIVNYNLQEPINTIAIECPECGEDISAVIDE